MRREFHAPLRRAFPDLIAISLLPLALLTIHAITPEPTREILSFQFSDPTIMTAWTSSVVHRSWTHVLANSFMFVIAVGCVYVIFRLWERRGALWVIFAGILLLTPPITAVFDYTILHLHLGVTPDDATTRGFSGVANAYVGMLVATLGFFVAHRTTRQVGAAVVFAIYLLAALVFLLVHRALTVTAGGIITFGILLAGFWIITAIGSPQDYDLARIVSGRELEIVVVSYSIVVILVAIYAGFPADITNGGTTTNILSHGTGLLAGFGITTAIIGSRSLSDALSRFH